MSRQNVMIALPMEENLLHPLYAWGKRFDWSHVGAVHIIHVVKKNITPFEYGLVEMPDEKTFEAMTSTLNRFLRDEAQKIIPESYLGDVKFHLSTDFNPEEEVVAQLKRVKSSVLVVSTAGKHGFEGLFHNSFTDHMIKFAPCDVYVVRPS
jgi:nucleotide-binding universal stress UspA family protein